MAAIHLLTGANDVAKRRRIDALSASFDAESRVSFFADERDAPAIFAECYQSSLFGGDQAVVVKQAGDLKDSAKKKFAQSLIQYASNVNPDMTLVVDWEDPPAEVSKKLGAMKGTVEIEEFELGYRTDLERFVRSSLKEYGLNAENGVAEFILEMIDSGEFVRKEDVEEADRVCRSLRDYAGEGGRVTLADAENLLSHSHNLSIFDLTDGIFSRDVELALRSLNDLRLNSEPVLKINATLLSNARSAWGFKTLKCPDEQKQKILGMRNFPFKKLKKFAAGFDLRYVSRTLELVRNIDVKSKTMPEEFAFIELENFILTMRD